MPIKTRRKELRGQWEKPDYGRLILQDSNRDFRDGKKVQKHSLQVKICRRVFFILSALVLLTGMAFTLF